MYDERHFEDSINDVSRPPALSTQNGAYTKCRFLVLFHCVACRRESAHQPDDFNGYGYFYLRVFCTCLGFQANVVEEYGLLTALQHIFAGFEEDSRSEVVFWIDEWSIEFGTDDY